MADANANAAVVQVAPDDAGAVDVDMDDRARMRAFVLELRRFQKQGVAPFTEEECDYFMRMPRSGRDPAHFDVSSAQVVPIATSTLPATMRTRFDVEPGGDTEPNPHGLVDGEKHEFLARTAWSLNARPALQNTDLHTDAVDVDTYLSTGAAARNAGFTATPGDEDLHPLLHPNDPTVDRRQKHYIARVAGRDAATEIDTTSSEAIEATLSQRDGPILGTPTGLRGSSYGVPGSINPNLDVFTSSLIAKSEKDLLVGFLASRALVPSAGSQGWGAGGMKLFFDDSTRESLRASILGRVALVYPGAVCPFFDMDGHVYGRKDDDGYSPETVDTQVGCTAAELRATWDNHKLDVTPADDDGVTMKRARFAPPLADFAVENAVADEFDYYTHLYQFDPLVAPQPVMQLNIRPDTLSESEHPALEHNVNGFHKEQRLYPMPPALVKALLAAIEKHDLAHEFPMLMHLRGSRDKALLNVDGLRAGAVARLAKRHSVESFVGFTTQQIRNLDACPTSAEEKQSWTSFLEACSLATFCLTWVRRRSAFQPMGIAYACGEAGYTGSTGAVIEAGKPVPMRERRANEALFPGDEGCDYTYELVPLLDWRPEDFNGRTLPLLPAPGGHLGTFFTWASDAWVKNAASPPPYPTSVERLKGRLDRQKTDLEIAEGTIERLKAQQTRLTKERDEARNALRALERRNAAAGKSLVVADGGSARVLLSGPMATLDVYSKRGSLHCSTDASDEGYPIRVAKRARGSPLHQAVVAATAHTTDAADAADAADLSVLRVAFFPSAAERDAQLRSTDTSGW